MGLAYPLRLESTEILYFVALHCLNMEAVKNTAKSATGEHSQFKSGNPPLHLSVCNDR